jgi:hypothetical protein
MRLLDFSRFLIFVSAKGMQNYKNDTTACVKNIGYEMVVSNLFCIFAIILKGYK